MCAVCWTGTQIIPATALAARYVWVNHFQLRRTPKVAEHQTADDPDHEAAGPHEHEVEEPVGV